MHEIAAIKQWARHVLAFSPPWKWPRPVHWRVRGSLRGFKVILGEVQMADARLCSKSEISQAMFAFFMPERVNELPVAARNVNKDTRTHL
jgi:hypothetical protein